MSSPSRSLYVFIAHRPEVISSAATTNVSSWTSPSTFSKNLFQLLSSFVPASLGLTARTKILHTVYGLAVMQPEPQGRLSCYEIELCAPSNSTGPGQTPEYHYRIFPDWGTSFFWKNLEYNSPPWKGNPAIEDDNIESRYPRLAPHFFAWRDRYEDGFEKQELHLGNKAEVFPDVEVRVAWYTEGFLMACWLALQPGVVSVEFSSVKKKYRIEKASVDTELEAFLNEMDSLLEQTQ